MVLPLQAEEEMSIKDIAPEQQVVGSENSIGSTIHHDLFTYPLNPGPNPAFAPFFEKLENVKKQLDTL